MTVSKMIRLKHKNKKKNPIKLDLVQMMKNLKKRTNK